MVADTWWAYLFLNLAMGSYLDQPIAQWDDMFVPQRVREQLNKATHRSAGGEVAPLVRTERQLVQADRKPPPDQPPNRTLVDTLAGAALGSLMGWLGFRLLSMPAGRKTPRSRRMLFALPLGALTTFTGFLGCLFLFFWVWTDHAVAWHNENLLQTNPIAIGMPVIAIGLLGDRGWARKGYPWLSYALAASALLGLLLKALPFWFKQLNAELIGLLLPVWLGLAAASWLARRASLKR